MAHMENESHVGNKKDDEEHADDKKAHLEGSKRLIDLKAALHQSNLNPERPDESILRTLNSSTICCTSVIKKLKMINSELKDGLIEDLNSVNLSEFVKEAADSICEANLGSSDKQADLGSSDIQADLGSSDIQAAVQICSLLHLRYMDFSPSLVQGLLKALFPGSSGELDSGENTRTVKKRYTLRLLMELFLVGVIEDASTFTTIVKDLTSLKHLKDWETAQTNLSLLTTFSHEGKFFFGCPEHEEDAYYDVRKTSVDYHLLTDQTTRQHRRSLVLAN